MSQSFSCACGQAKVEVLSDAPSAFSAICHCANCREITGAPFFWGNAWPGDQVRVTGETLAHQHVSNIRHSCARCGATMHEELPAFGGLVMLPAARLPTPTAPMFHIFVRSKVYTLPDDGLPRFDEMPPLG